MRHFSRFTCRPSPPEHWFLTTGCAPSVYHEHSKKLPGPHRGSTVLVYDMADSLPEPGRCLGQRHGQWTADFRSTAIMRRSCSGPRTKRTKIGGNGLHLVWHKEPSALGSSCHRIAAHMLLLPDSVYTASYFDNVSGAERPAGGIRSHTGRRNSCAGEGDAQNGKQQHADIQCRIRLYHQ